MQLQTKCNKTESFAAQYKDTVQLKKYIQKSLPIVEYTKRVNTTTSICLRPTLEPRGVRGATHFKRRQDLWIMNL
jgi:hypothetical protein